MSKMEKTMHSAKIVCVSLISILFITATAPAEKRHIREGFWGGIDAGAGYLQQSLGDERKDDTSFFLGFKVGYTINPHFLIGLELSGWLLETSNLWDSDEGKGINQIFLVTQLYPSKDSGLFAKVGGGYVKRLTLPYVEKLKKGKLTETQIALLDVIESSLHEIISPFSLKLASNSFGLTPSEIKVASLIKQGKGTKEIATIRNLSQKTVARHRENIRKKLGIKKKKVNLQSHLTSLA